ncbi:hypothetical protein JX580_06230 [Thiomicrospira microaerophila]|uniref:hypothetical protein n=1 Tax=Thiomicrospira microaerophila TaxID=406020 RepID=UPI00200BC657|nr:hypothetical protein [Thiomicrospira microaerophila]UQB41298.1 hypothetical protein JX580_06230 [Thiomicrospira microaerophila]
MIKTVVVVGLGELGSVFARGFLKLGYSVVPVNRGDSMQKLVGLVKPEAVVIAVGEADIHSLLTEVPDEWKQKVVLIQNELLPRDWRAHSFDRPTVISVWFEKKKGMDSKVVIPSPVFGPKASLVSEALATLGLPSFIVETEEALEFELVLKNLYILTTNIAGLEVGGNVAELAQHHTELMNNVAEDVLKIQDWLTNHQQDRVKLMAGLKKAFEGDPQHQSMGRSAPIRLQRALGYALEAGLVVNHLRAIADKHLN